jgi:hypothetical protein
MVSRLEKGGGALVLDGDRIKYSVPKGSNEAQELLAELRKHREEVQELLRQRAISGGAESRFRQPHAKLFPFIGRKVRTSSGPGVLLQAFADRVTVLLDSELSKCAVFAPQEVAPCDWSV